jgi:hypothetical protein
LGLDAHVYRNRKHLPPGLRELHLNYIPESGELFFEDDAVTDRNWDVIFAIHRRIGNIDLVAHLREEIVQVFGHAESLLSRKVVYSGSHAGDWIPRSENDQLERELEFLSVHPKVGQSKFLPQFIKTMRELLEVARREDNPINF